MKIALVAALVVAPLLNPQPTVDPTPNYAMGVIADQPAVPAGYFVGTATWYDAARPHHSSWYTREGITIYGAIGATLRAYKTHYYRTSWDVKITSLWTDRSVVVHVVDECSCYGVRGVKGDEPLIDLSPATWWALGVPLKYGVMPITLEVLP
jgi:rare lipoprotein A (peptidoglycan hydrolase)